MSLSAGTRLGQYEIQAAIGSGGMGEVYRATDTKLGRSVAIKVLPEMFAADADRTARFEREARVLASLNHPHIAAIHGLEEVGGWKFLVMELVEGPTLQQRLEAGDMGLEKPKPPDSSLQSQRHIPPDEALAIARQIAEALEAAHDSGVIHRDLKPANIKVTPAGQVKVLDFGLAKFWIGDGAEAGSGAKNLTHSPTMTVAGTNTGVILGTAAYMSPEQAKGKLVDRRTDIFAFGCVLYEMLTGHPAFAGETVTEILARVIERQPDWDRLPAGVSPRIQELLRSCLEKDPNKRRRDSGDIRLEIDRALAEPLQPPAIAHSSPRRASWLAWMVAGLLGLGLAAAVAALYLRRPNAAPEMVLEINTPPSSDPFSFAISPDGRQLVFAASGDGQSRLHLRPLDAKVAQSLEGTEGATYPFWSPDGRAIGFFAEGKLKRFDIGGGRVQALSAAQPGVGGTWSRDGTILFAPFTAGPLFRVPANGGEAVAATKVVRGQLGHSFPTFITGGRQFLFYARGPDESQGIYLGSLDAPEETRLTPADTPGLYVPPGWLLFVSQGRLVARHFDPVGRELSGDAVTIAVIGSPFVTLFVARNFSASESGHVVYRVGSPTSTQLTWFDRSGRVIERLGTPERASLANPALSPDGRRVAFNRTVQGNVDIWVLDGARLTRLTSDSTVDQFPIWSADGDRIFFDTNRNGTDVNIYQKSSRAQGTEEPVLEGQAPIKIATDVSSDGRFLMYFSVDAKTGTDLWVLPLMENARPFPFLTTNSAEVWGQFSPDSRWVAYQSFESGQWEVYIRPFPGPGGQWPVSTSGGAYPRWSSDGKELYYLDPTGKLMAAPIAAKADSPEVGTPVVLFQTRILGGGVNTVGRNHQYDVAPNGRFLINVLTDEAAISPLTILLNWKPPSQ
jgi:serine/threonine protein kinase